MIRRDFHGWTVDNATQAVELIVGDIRMRAVTEDVEFITGHGPIRDAVFDLLTLYNLSPKQQLGNSGVIIATIS